MGKPGGALILGLLLVSCGELDRPTTYAPRVPPAMPPGAVVTSPPMQTPVAPAPSVAEAPADACGARALAYLVGRPKTEIPIPVNPAQRRVACDTCPVTEEYSPWRLNIFYSDKTGRITEVRCG